MQINLMLNGVRVSDDVAPDTLLIDFVRRHGCLSVKRGCETSNCGLCTVFLDDKPVLSCSGKIHTRLPKKSKNILPAISAAAPAMRASCAAS